MVVFPTIPKVAKIAPVLYKKDFKLDFTNYCPISLKSNIEKILEKLIHNRIYNFLTKNNLINPLQFGGFRQQYSTFHSLTSLTKDIGKKLFKGNIGSGIFVVQKAFDTVEHDILLAKLEHNDICGIANEWFKSNLFDRKQFVFINVHLSSLYKNWCPTRFISWTTFVLDIYQ